MSKPVQDPPASLTTSVVPVPPASGKPFRFLWTVIGLIIKGALGFILLIMALATNAWMSSWGAASVAVASGAIACFLLARKVGSVNARGVATIYALGSGIGLLITFAPPRKPEASVEVAQRPVEDAEKRAEAAAVEMPAAVETAPERPEPVDEKSRALAARVMCMSETQDNYPGVDWKFFHNIQEKPAADHMEVTIEGQRESQAYRVVCNVPDGDAPTTHALYRVDAKSKKMSVETKTLEPCYTMWTAKSVCRPERAQSAPVVAPGKRIDDAEGQCRRLAVNGYPEVEWRWLRGISSDWAELGGVHGVRTSIQGTRNGQNLNITCFLPDGASKPLHEVSAL